MSGSRKRLVSWSASGRGGTKAMEKAVGDLFKGLQEVYGIKSRSTFLEMGEYTVRAKAKDIFDAEGPWGAEMIPILRSRQMINSWFQLFFDRFPLLEKLLSLFRVI